MGDRKPLNLAGRLAHAFLESRITVLIMLGLTLFGVLAINVTPRLYNPEIVVPAAQIIVARPGQTPGEIRAQVIEPLEALMAGLAGVKHTYGYAVDDMGVVTVQFEVGRNEVDSLLLLYNELQRNMDRFPPGTQRPLVKSIGITDVPIVTITLSSASLDGVALREIAQKFLARLRAIPDVGTSRVIGGQRRAVNVLIDPQRLASSGIALDSLQDMLKASNAVVPAGHLVNNNRIIDLRVDGAFADVQDLGDIIIGAPDNRPVYLKEVARVEYGPTDAEQYLTFARGRADAQAGPVGDTVPAVTLTLGKRPGSNAVKVADRVLNKLQELKRDALPQGVDVTVTRNYGRRADQAVNTLIEHLAIAILAVAVILILFLGWREAGIVTLTVPLTLFAVLGTGLVIGQTINRITLFALILSLGLLVDAAIVVIENIHRHLHKGEHDDFKSMLVTATNEIGNPTNVATIAVVLAFIPMAFVGGMMGPFMRPIPINVPVTMLASLVLAYIVVPWAARHWLYGKALKVLAARAAIDELQIKQDVLQRSYVSAIRPLLRNRHLRSLFWLVVIGLLLLSLLMPAWQFIRPAGMNGPLSPLGVNLKLLPEGNVNTFMLEVLMPEGTAVESTARVVEAIDTVLNDNPYITDYQNYLGRPSPLTFASMVRGDAIRRGSNLAQIRVNLVEAEHRPKTATLGADVYAALKAVRQRFPDSRIKLYLTPPGPPVQSQVVAELYGPDYTLLRKTAEQVKEEFRHTYGMINVDDSVTTAVPQYRLHIDQRKAMLSGIAPGELATRIHDLVSGVSLGAIHTDYPEPVNIIARLDRANRAWIEQIADMTVRGAGNKPVPIGSLVHIERGTLAKPIYDRDQHPVVYVTGDLLNASPVYATLSLDKRLDGLVLADGVQLRTGNLGFVETQADDVTDNQVLWGGDMRLTLDVFRDLGTAFIVALVFIYLLLVAYYQSFALPMIVMGAIPLTLVGIFPGHWLFDMPFNATSMIGFIALAGIVVRNSLLLMDFVLDYRQQGFSLEESVIEAGAVRFRPILLTALAIMLGSTVMVSDPVFGGLGISLIFGTLASTLLTLLVIPLLYYSWQRRSPSQQVESK